ncbi:unnamed protein product [Schistosoma margrebowiei]|uniref:Uncharacterized protein n=2 Tax=Schistosoma margrebowiei TaxID=48269 RepID=A0AA84ZCS9_9TREM|nr:unnamed protein product [Schistosoma margrebowiei]
MEVQTEKRDENLDEPPLIPIRAAPGSTPRQPPLLETSSDYSVWKFKVTAYLQRVPLTEHFNYLVSYLSDEAVRRAIANGFAASNTLSQNWRILDDCFSMPVDTQQMTIQFLSRHQKASESPIDYLHSLQQVAVQAFPRLDMIGREELIRSRFVEGLLPGPLKEHFLRNPPADTSEVKRTTLRFLAADKLVNSASAHSSSVTTVERATKPSGPDTCQTTVAVTDLPGRGVIHRQSNSRWNKQPAWGNYNGRQAGCIYCKRFGRNARRCGHNRPRKPEQARINALEEEEQALHALNLQDDS